MPPQGRDPQDRCLRGAAPPVPAAGDLRVQDHVPAGMACREGCHLAGVHGPGSARLCLRRVRTVACQRSGEGGRVMTPYYADDLVTLYHGDCREVLPALGVTADCVVTDPPYGETSLEWDRWQDGWLAVAATVARSLWCFGSMRMYLDHAAEFTASWKFSQDVIWEKHNGSSSASDRFKRVHEIPTHWYRGDWSAIYHETPTTADAVKHQMRRKHRPPQ